MNKICVTLTLEKNMNTETILYRVRKGWCLRFELGVSLAGYDLQFFTNYPSGPNEPFIRSKYSSIDVINPVHNTNDSSDNYFEIETHQSGAFQFYFTSKNNSDKLGEGYFIVDPRFGEGKISWELDGLVLQTYLAKNLGKLSEWLPKLQVSKEAGYNMIHFTPLQELGYSRSAYSLCDHLKLNPEFCGSWADVEKLVTYMETEWNMLSMTDLVFNHVASNSPWLHAHPECAYNLINSPHLRPAYLLDRLIWNVTLEAAEGKLEHKGLKAFFEHDWQVESIRKIIWEKINEFQLMDYFLADVESVVSEFSSYIHRLGDSTVNCSDNPQPIYLQHNGYHRKKSSVNMQDAALQFFRPTRNVHEACNQLRNLLHELNKQSLERFYDNMNGAVDNVLGNARYRFVDSHGMRLGVINENSPIMWTYFYHPGHELNIREIEKLIDDPNHARSVMAYNGWVMGGDPMINFAEPTSNVYLRRELVVWGDSVKLRYGENEADCPYLWQKMKEYTQMTAKMFPAVRLDNCHGTPLHVAQWMLDQARAVRKDLYIVAELFTGSFPLDHTFINKLGINSLIREALAAFDSHEMGRIIHRFGGLPVGSFVQPEVRPLHPSMAHALIYDATHDNEAAILKRSVLDILPTGAMVCMAQCAIGSNRGFDEMVPHYIDVVAEERQYRPWLENATNDTYTHWKSGIIAAKALLNRLHQKLIKENFTEMFIDQVDSDVVAITRHSSTNRMSYVLIAHTAFQMPSGLHHRHVKSIQLPGKLLNVEFEIKTRINKPNIHDILSDFKRDENFINGISSQTTSAFICSQSIPIERSTMVRVDDVSTTGGQNLHFVDFPPGSVILLSVELFGSAKKSLQTLHLLIEREFKSKIRSRSCGPILAYKEDTTASSPHFDNIKSFQEISRTLNFYDLNFILFRCEAEDRTDNPNSGSYSVPDLSSLNYCGLQSVVNLLNKIRENNDLGHPLCNNIRQGNWLMTYISNRLIHYWHKPVQELGLLFQSFFTHISNLPNYLQPCYFDCIIFNMHKLIMKEIYCRLDMQLQSSSFHRQLCVNSFIFLGTVSNCQLPPLHHSVMQGLSTSLSKQLDNNKGSPTIAAGLPHFSSGLFRAWGRDTFIAFKGLLLLTNRLEEAKVLLLSYAALLRHGLMPNLLGNWNSVEKSIHSRFNCRDAVWWWLYCIQQYCEITNDDKGQFLETKVLRFFNPQREREFYTTQDPGWLRCPKNIQLEETTLGQLVYEALSRHAEGIDFYEWGAGRELDENMTQEGFHVTAGLYTDRGKPTGFPCGGNSYNCGTWMDKMGGSDKAGNRGKPATSRNGVSVELVGLCYAVVKWIDQLSQKGHFHKSGVTLKSMQGNVIQEHFTWSQWVKALQDNFETHFWIREDEKNPECAYNAGGYKDLVGSAERFPDFQFRPNFLITMAVAPDLFNVKNAWCALNRARNELLGPLGMRTLAKYDYQYRGWYDNQNHSDDFHTAAGFNYHQGPEWVWPTGFYLLSYLKIAILYSKQQQKPEVLKESVSHLWQVLARLRNHINDSSWNSLPELTNEDGAFCRDSCPAQAWSAACVLEALFALINRDS